MLALRSVFQFTFKHLWETAVEETYLAEIEDGSYVLITHGTEEGTVINGDKVPDGTYVVCCHPKQAKKANPRLNIIGSWDTRTKAKIDGNNVTILEEVLHD